ncbi:RusA family crossover junction endodeoxyribonuclease [Streptomyces sp. NPDC019990]|uniref:RusA family crossover junction endodeoxyribonuclease n=1 Tax=Streptomyces sp. NPDC019990 TaxID=3154693 RepID=UPI0033E9C5F8
MTGLSDREWGERLMQLLAPEAEQSWGTILLGEPHSKARPRFDPDGHAYKDPVDAAAEQATKWRMRQFWKRGPLTGNVALGCVFFRSTRQEIDSDNMLKHVCDAGNGLLWLDDSQITAKYGGIELDPANPRTILVMAPHVSTMQRGTDYVRDCEGCGQTFTPTRYTQKCCSRECVPAARRVKAARS